MLMLFEKFLPPERKYQVDEVILVTFIPIWPPSTSVPVELREETVPSLRFPS